MNQVEAPEGIEIKRDLQEEQGRNCKTYCFKIYNQNKEIGVAIYQLLGKSQDLRWYIDEFVIYDGYEQKGYGTYLMNYVCNQMWSEIQIPIYILPAEWKMKKEDFIKWLTNPKRNFVMNPSFWPGKVFLTRYPSQ